MPSMNPKSQSMWDIPYSQEETQRPLSALDEQFMEFKTKGNLNPGNPGHRPIIDDMINAISSGLVSERSVRNMAKANEYSATLFLNAFDNYKRSQAQRAEMGRFFNPGSPAVPDRPFTDADQGTGVGPLMPGTPIMGTGKPAVEPKADYQGAMLWAEQNGMRDLAKHYREMSQGGDQFKHGDLHLKLRAADKKTGNPYWDDFTPNEAQIALDSNKTPLTVTFTGKYGEQNTEFVDANKARKNPTVPRGGDIRPDLQKLTEVSDKNMFPRLDESVDRIDKLLAKSKNNARGIGGLKNATTWAQVLSTDDQKHFNQAVRSIMNPEILKFAGSAASVSEETRQQLEKGLSYVNKPEDFLNWLDNHWKPAQIAARKEFAAQVSPAALKDWESRAGTRYTAPKWMKKQDPQPTAETGGKRVIKFEDLP